MMEDEGNAVSDVKAGCRFFFSLALFTLEAKEPRLCYIPVDGPVFLPGWVWLGQTLFVLSKGGKHNECLLERS